MVRKGTNSSLTFVAMIKNLNSVLNCNQQNSPSIYNRSYVSRGLLWAASLTMSNQLKKPDLKKTMFPNHAFVSYVVSYPLHIRGNKQKENYNKHHLSRGFLSTFTNYNLAL